MTDRQERYVGAPVRRKDDPRLLTGGGRYVDDQRLPRMLYIAFVRSPHAHAHVTTIALEAARCLPGVTGILTGEEVRDLCKPYTDRPVFSRCFL